MANYGDDGQLTADLENGAFGRGKLVLGSLDRESRFYKKKTGIIADFQNSKPEHFSFLEECVRGFHARKPSGDQLPLITLSLPQQYQNLSKVLINGTKAGSEQHFNCAFRFLPDGSLQIGASHRTFEVFDEDHAKKKRKTTEKSKK